MRFTSGRWKEGLAGLNSPATRFLVSVCVSLELGVALGTPLSRERKSKSVWKDQESRSRRIAETHVVAQLEDTLSHELAVGFLLGRKVLLALLRECEEVAARERSRERGEGGGWAGSWQRMRISKRSSCISRVKASPWSFDLLGKVAAIRLVDCTEMQEQRISCGSVSTSIDSETDAPSSIPRISV